MATLDLGEEAFKKLYLSLHFCSSKLVWLLIALAYAIFPESYMTLVPRIHFLTGTVLVPGFLSSDPGQSCCLLNLPGVLRSSKNI